MIRILIVEDDEPNRVMMSRRLQDRGFEIIVAADGLEAVSKAGSEKPDLILMDMSLPLLDGWEATQMIKSESKTFSIPIIGLSAHALSGDRDKALEAGCDEYEIKPVDLQRLLAKMESLLAERQIKRSKPASILVADDDESTQGLLTRRLEQLGHSVTVAADGPTALQLIRQQPFDLVLLDIMMPGMNGFEVLKMVRENLSPTVLPVIMVSARDERSDIVYALEVGANDYITKPLDFPVVQARVETQLALKRAVERIRVLEKRADDLLRIVLPDSIAEELKANDEVKPRRHDDVAVLFADVVDFTQYCDTREPDEVLDNLQQMVQAFEGLVHKHDLIKLKTIGDSFMASGGLLHPVENPVANCVRCGLEMISAMTALKPAWKLRVGIHVGPVIAGIVGHHRYVFDIWGDTVNIAARMEEHGTPGAVSLSRKAWERVATDFECISSKSITVKGKGELEIFHITPP